MMARRYIAFWWGNLGMETCLDVGQNKMGGKLNGKFVKINNL